MWSLHQHVHNKDWKNPKTSETNQSTYITTCTFKVNVHTHQALEHPRTHRSQTRNTYRHMNTDPPRQAPPQIKLPFMTYIISTIQTICLFILHINESIFQTAATEGELSTNRVGLGDLAESVHQSAFARAHVTCNISKNDNLSSPSVHMYELVIGHKCWVPFPKGDALNWVMLLDRIAKLN